MRRDADGRPSLSAVRGAGVFIILISLGLGYFVLLRPVLQALRTGMLRYSFMAVLMPPAFLYFGIALQMTDLRDGTIREMGPDGKPRMTRKGKLFMAGLVLVLTVSVSAWYTMLHVMGFQEIP